MKKHQVFSIILVSSLLLLAGYLLFSTATFRTGFPLDDAWIHQTYARNLIEYGQWAYIPGQPSAGSTAPLWTILLSVGYLLELPALIWVFLIGWFTLVLIAWFAYRYGESEFPAHQAIAWLAVGILLVEYHLIWAALSGMETLLFGLIILWVIPARKIFKYSEIATGFILGLAVWIRPDGLLLILPLLVMLSAENKNMTDAIKSITRVLLVFAVLFIPYLIFNYYSAGAVWPSTFYAKQAEYAELLQIPLLDRIIRLYSLPLIGSGILLLPGFLWYGIQAVKNWDWPVIAGYLWFIGFIGVYVLRLPVIYQHGRYIIPVMPVYLLFGISGLPGFFELFGGRFRFVLSRVWIVALPLVAMVFWWWGGKAYALDVAVIESEMVDTAKWIASTTAPEAKIAAHDIGALGYFGGREILDLAGLISPEVIPIIRDESSLIDFINEYQADYLVTFPDWYDVLPDCGEIVFTSKGEFVDRFGQQNMTVYRWNPICWLP